MNRVQIDQFQDILRQFLENGRVEDAILCFKDYLQNENINNSDISDSLIIISSSHRKSLTDYAKNLIDFETRLRERNKTIESLLKLIRELPRAIEFENKKRLTISTQNKTIKAIGHFQEENIVNLRRELLATDDIIIKLIKKLEEKEREIAIQRVSAKLEHLNNEIEKLKNRIREEEEKYKNLKAKYDKIRKEKERIEKLIKEVVLLMEELKLKNEQIAELKIKAESNHNSLMQKETELVELKQKAIEVSENSIILYKKTIKYFIAILIGFILIYLTQALIGS